MCFWNSAIVRDLLWGDMAPCYRWAGLVRLGRFVASDDGAVLVRDGERQGGGFALAGAGPALEEVAGRADGGGLGGGHRGLGARDRGDRGRGDLDPVDARPRRDRADG